VLSAPLLQEYEHAYTATAKSLQFREVEHNRADSDLLCDGIAQPEGSLTTYNSAFTLNDSHISYSLHVHL
jgi:hypothetical protein